jgi:hypothetical protein
LLAHHFCFRRLEGTLSEADDYTKFSLD